MIECRSIEMQNIIIEGFHNIWFSFRYRGSGTYSCSSLSIDEENQNENEEEDEDDHYIDDAKSVFGSQND
jgi:hypothetical protein